MHRYVFRALTRLSIALGHASIAADRLAIRFSDLADAVDNFADRFATRQGLDPVEMHQLND